MKTILFAAAGSLFLAFAAHAADAPQAGDAQPSATQTAPSLGASSNNSACIDTATVSRTAYSTDDDAEGDSTACSHFLSTQMLVQPIAAGRT